MLCGIMGPTQWHVCGYFFFLNQTIVVTTQQQKYSIRFWKVVQFCWAIWRIYCLGLLCRCCFFFFSSSTNIDDGEIGCNIGAHCCTKWDYNILLVCVLQYWKGSYHPPFSKVISYPLILVLQGWRYVLGWEVKWNII